MVLVYVQPGANFEESLNVPVQRAFSSKIEEMDSNPTTGSTFQNLGSSDRKLHPP